MRLLASDLDGTLLGDDERLRQLAVELESRRDGLLLAYVTGRSTASTLELLESVRLPRPDYLITALGGEILRAPWWKPERAWVRHLSPGWSAERIQAMAAFFRGLEPQPPRHQDRFKVSFTVLRDDASYTLDLLRRTLRTHRIPARCVYSSSRDLDIVPERSGKGNALRYLAQSLKLDPTSVLACGDSSNDLDMLQAGFLAATPANALPELLAGLDESAFKARSPFAAGVHEALCHFGWL